MSNNNTFLDTYGYDGLILILRPNTAIGRANTERARNTLVTHGYLVSFEGHYNREYKLTDKGRDTLARILVALNPIMP